MIDLLSPKTENIFLVHLSITTYFKASTVNEYKSVYRTLKNKNIFTEFPYKLSPCFICCRNDWKAFHAQTNVFWLHYLADKLIRGKRYKRNTKKDQALLRELRNFSKDMLEYTSACDLIVSSEFFSWFIFYLRLYTKNLRKKRN